MPAYFAPEKSLHCGIGADIRQAIGIIARRYIGENPPLPFVFHAFPENGFAQDHEGRFLMDLNSRAPDALLGSYSYAFAMLWSDQNSQGEFAINCYGPVQVYCNGTLAFKPDIVEEVNRSITRQFNAPLRQGWNGIFLKFRKTASGFGCCFGSRESKWLPMDFMAPFAERRGQAGWIWASPTTTDVFPDSAIPSVDAEEASDTVCWQPIVSYPETETREPLERIFAEAPQGTIAYIWTRLPAGHRHAQERLLKGHSNGPIQIWLDGQFMGSSASEDFTFALPPTATGHLLVEATRPIRPWALDLEYQVDGQTIALQQPVPVQGYAQPYLYLGPFMAPLEQPSTLCKLTQVVTVAEQQYYWRIDLPASRLRPYLENANFGRWNYPLGVTLYGLLQTGRVLNDAAIRDYVYAHMSQCTAYYELAQWDTAQVGYPSIDQQLVELNMLDDCGSFGSAMLESYTDTHDVASRSIADIAADYMRNRQERRDDGAFYRNRKGTFNENTMWVDDLYMSTPFMLRYAALTGDSSWLDDAAQQFLLFKNYLFMPKVQLMSHVYDFKYHTRTEVPWGRGNGWAFFSLSEILAVLPVEHPKRLALLAFFNELAQGILAVQSETGLWHQVLTEPEAYLESSCTSMFIYGLCRGLRNGWFSPDIATQAEPAIRKAWNGLIHHAIDQKGNVYGVCIGSRYSFTKEYYMHELGTRLNDTHGIGIVLLAGIEIAKLDGL